jgi:hypothetical protein
MQWLRILAPSARFCGQPDWATLNARHLTLKFRRKIADSGAERVSVSSFGMRVGESLTASAPLKCNGSEFLRLLRVFVANPTGQHSTLNAQHLTLKFRRKIADSGAERVSVSSFGMRVGESLTASAPLNAVAPNFCVFCAFLRPTRLGNTQHSCLNPSSVLCPLSSVFRLPG